MSSPQDTAPTPLFSTSAGWKAGAARAWRLVFIVVFRVRLRWMDFGRRTSRVPRRTSQEDHICVRSRAPTRQSRMPSTILVAEDQADIRDLIVMNLRNAGYEV